MEIKIKTEKTYPINVGFENVYDELRLTNEAYFICIDSRVLLFHKEYLQPLLDNAIAYVVIEAKESNKTQSSIDKIHEMFFEHHATRSSILIGIGGGIIGDISGLAAALYMRGIKYIQMPTTLLSQVDSSIGSKVAINKNNTKNTIGTFYSPNQVIIDLRFLSTLTQRLFKEGLVELIKHGYIVDETIINDINDYQNISALINDLDGLKKLIIKSLLVKAQVVENDPLDLGNRHILNYGHTLAHAIELSPNVNLYHGECVAIGMLCNAVINDDKKLYTNMKLLFEKLELVKPFPDIDFSKMIHDKKRTTNDIKEIFIKEVAQPEIKSCQLNELIETYQNIYPIVAQDIKTCPTQYTFNKVNLKGHVNIPPSKSQTHRYLIAAALANTDCQLNGISSVFDDVIVTMEALSAFGIEAKYNKTKQCINIKPNPNLVKNSIINMKESGTSLRLLMPLLIHFNDVISITGENKLPVRPLLPYLKLFDENKIKYKYLEENKYLPITLEGNFKAGKYEIAGDISSQFISGLLYTLPLLDGDSTIILTSPLQSIPYIEMTLACLKDFGIKIEYTSDYDSFSIKGNQTYQAKTEYSIEQDYSSRGFFDVLASFNQHEIIIDNPISPTHQGDSVVIDIISNKENILDLTNVPDTAPAMAVYYAINGGSMQNTERLAFKESDRLSAICEFLDTMAIKYDKIDNNITIYPRKIKGGYFNTHQDHRITMALIVASTISSEPVVIDEIKSINKSFATFLDEYEKCGGFINEK